MSSLGGRRSVTGQDTFFVLFTLIIILIIIIIIMYIYHALINALSAHIIHINLTDILYILSQLLLVQSNFHFHSAPASRKK